MNAVMFAACVVFVAVHVTIAHVSQEKLQNVTHVAIVMCSAHGPWNIFWMVLTQPGTIGTSGTGNSDLESFKLLWDEQQLNSYS